MKAHLSRRDKVFTLLIVALLVTNVTTISAYLNFAYAALPTKWDTQGPDCPYAFCVYTDGTTIWRKNGTSGVAVSGTNATTIIQGAMNSLSTGRTWKETVYVQGNYSLSGYLVPPSYTVLKTDGRYTWTGAAGAGTYMIGLSGTTSDVDVVGGNFNVNSAADYAIRLVSGSTARIHITGISVNGFPAGGGAISISNTQFVEVSNSIFTDNNLGIGINVLAGAVDVNIHNNFFSRFDDASVSVGTGTATQIRRVTVHDNIVYGYAANGGGMNCYGNTVACELIDNVMYVGGSRAFSTETSGGYFPQYTRISGNIAYNYSYAAVWLQGSKYTQVTNNFFNSTREPLEQAIIATTADNYNLQITGNFVGMRLNNSFANIQLDDALVSGFTTISNNHISGGASGVTANTPIAGGIIANNVITNTWYYGLELNGVHNYVVTGNHISNITQSGGSAGIRLADRAGLYAVNNTILGNRLVNVTIGIQEVQHSNNTLISNNNVKGSTGSAISFVGTNTVVTNNIGYKTENGGAASVANAGTVTHTLAATPTYATCTTTNSSNVCSVTAVAATTITIGLRDLAGNTVGTAETIYWTAVYKP